MSHFICQVSSKPAPPPYHESGCVRAQLRLEC